MLGVGEKCLHPINIHANINLTLGRLCNSDWEWEKSVVLEYIVKKETFKVGPRTYTNSSNLWLLPPSQFWTTKIAVPRRTGQQKSLSLRPPLPKTLRLLKELCVFRVERELEIKCIHILCITCTFWDIQYCGNQEGETLMS